MESQLTLFGMVSIIERVVWNRMDLKKKSVEAAIEEAVSRAVRDNLAPLQRTVEELQNAYADLVSACSSSRPSNALPAMLRAQAAAASLSAGLAVLSNFVTIALHPRERRAGDQQPPQLATAAGAAAARSLEGEEVEWADDVTVLPTPEAPAGAPAEALPAFDIAALPPDLQELHRRASRIAKVAMQDIKLLRPKDVKLGIEHKDVCQRLRGDIDKARKEYDRRFKSILDHPVDYFHDWMVAILADGDPEALGEYPYPSPVLHR